MTNNLKPLTRKEKILDGQNIKPINRDEYFIQKAVQSGGGGGGSSLPPYTSADKGKVLTVGEAEGEPKNVTVVTEQSITVEQKTRGVTLNTTADASKVQVGNTVYFTINGSTYTATVEDDGHGELYIPISENISVSVFPDSWFYSAPEGTYTISATADVLVTPSTTTVIVPEQTVTTAEMGGGYGGLIAGYDVADFVNDVQQYENFIISVGGNNYSASYNGEGILTENNEYIIAGVPGTGVVFGDAAATGSASYIISLSAVTPVPEAKWESNMIFQDLITENINCSFNELKKRCKTSPIFLYSESENSVGLYMLSNLNIETSGGVSTYYAVFRGANSLGANVNLTFISTDPDENMEINK